MRRTASVACIPFLYLTHTGLKGAHGPHLPRLLQSKRQRGQTHKDREDNDGQPELIEKHVVQQRKAIDHRVDDEEIEYAFYESHRLALRRRVQ